MTATTMLAPRLTAAQRAALQLAVDDGGCFDTTGIDRRRVRHDVIRRLREYGYVKYEFGMCADACHITPLGRAALERKEVT